MATDTTRPLLTTKLYVPPTRSRLVSRPRLIELLNAGLHRKLTLVSAPAGFGKTTLLSEWVAQCDRPVAWLSLDEGDNDVARFLAYFVAALRTIESLQDAIDGIEGGLASALQSAQQPDTESVLTSVINSIATDPRPFVLVLDDYYYIRAESIHEALTFLLDHQPPQMHLIIVTRTDPPLPLARLRGRGQLSELRQTDLRFTPEETAQFLNQAMGLELSAADLAALASRTEGWIAGLQMAAVSMQGREDVSGFVAGFTGSQHYILDYLVEEVLHQQPEEVQSFLLQTSILDRMSGSLCDAVTDTGNGQAMLENLEHANLFVLPLDDSRHWYRYHHLFADLLRQRLHQLYPDLVHALHRRASEWYEQNGLARLAIDHALSAGDFERAGAMIERAAEAAMMWSEVATLQRWVEALPAEILRCRPLLSVYQAWILLLRGQPLEVAKARLKEAVDADTGSEVAGEVAAIQGVIAAYKGEFSQTAELARRALDLLPEDRLFLRSLVAGYMGFAQLYSSDLATATAALEEAAIIAEGAGNLTNAVLARCHLAEVSALQGRFDEAGKLYEQILESAVDNRGRQQPIAGMALMGLGRVLAERYELEAATRHLLDGITLIEKWGEIAAIQGYVSLSRVKQAQGDTSGALEAIQVAEQLAIKFDAMKVDDIYVGASKVRLAVAQGNFEALSDWVGEHGLDREVGLDELETELGRTPLSQYRAVEYMTLAQVRIAQGRLDDALGLLKPLLQAVESAGHAAWAVRILVLQAVALQARGDATQALSTLERALSLAEPGGFVLTFVDQGEPMARLLRQAASRGIASAYVQKLLAVFDVSKAESAEEAVVSRPPQPLIEPLSERELQVLRLLNTRLSSTDIAEELIISVNTVRTHIRSVYSKLDVHSRYEAVARAKQLNLL